MSEASDAISVKSQAILEELTGVFGHTERGAGVTLHETSVIDDHGSAAEREQARRMDTDAH